MKTIPDVIWLACKLLAGVLALVFLETGLNFVSPAGCNLTGLTAVLVCAAHAARRICLIGPDTVWVTCRFQKSRKRITMFWWLAMCLGLPRVWIAVIVRIISNNMSAPPAERFTSKLDALHALRHTSLCH